MNDRIGERRCVSLLVVTTLLLTVVAGGVYAQNQGARPVLAYEAPPVRIEGTSRGVAPIDMTGTWVSVITEEWQYRMVTPAKGYFFSDQDYSKLPHGPGMDGEGG